MQFVTGRWMLDDGERHAYSADHVTELVHRLFEKRVVFHHEDGEVAPGVTVHRMPGHTMGMQSVRVPTRRGWVLLASDASHYYEHWVRRMPFAICWSRDDLLESYRKFEVLADSEDHVVPGHDPLVRSLRAPARRWWRASGTRPCSPRRARLSMPMPAASSAATRSSLQPFSPKDSRTAGSAIPAPSSVTVTVMLPSEPETATWTRVAPALRMFCRVSVKMSGSPAANVRVTRLMALS